MGTTDGLWCLFYFVHYAVVTIFLLLVRSGKTHFSNCPR